MQFCEPLQRYLRTTKAVIHMEHRPAEQTFTDYAGDKLYYYDPASGAAIACPVFVSVLPFSGYAYIEAHHSQHTEQMLQAMNHMVRYMDGVTESVTSDNMKQYVTKVLYLGMNRFVEKVILARIDGSFIKLLNSIEKFPLVILDVFGLAPMDDNTKLAMMQLLEDRYGRKSTFIVSQLPLAKWHQAIDEPTLADAIMDRLSASAHCIELKGPSKRTRKSK